MNRNQVLPQVELSSDPKTLSRIDFCAPQSYQGAGFLEISALPRVAEDASSVEPGDGFQWEVKTHFANSPGSEPQQILELAVKGRIHLVCQSCLQFQPVGLLEDDCLSFSLHGRWFGVVVGGVVVGVVAGDGVVVVAVVVVVYYAACYYRSLSL